MSLLSCPALGSLPLFFFFNDTATTEIYTLSLHDALPISGPDSRERPGGNLRSPRPAGRGGSGRRRGRNTASDHSGREDRKSTRLNSSHQIISYAVFCLKKKNRHIRKTITALMR